MTELAITPKWKDKEAKFRGVVAAGEHVAVTIQNDDGSGNAFISDTETLRLNVIDPTSGRLLATFPTPVEDGETPEIWSESGTQLSCELNLNTVQMLKAVLPASVASILFVLDDYENKTLYFKAQHEVAHWPRRRGEEEPLNLDGYKDIIRVFGLRLTAVEETTTSAAASAASAATSSATSAQAAKAAAAAATGSQGSAANSATAAETARNEAKNAANRAGVSEMGAKAAQTAAETAKTGAETARDEAKEYAESAESVLANAATKGALQAEVERATAAESNNATAIDETGKALATEVERAKTAEQNLANEFSEVGDKVDTVVGGDTGKSARTIAAEEVAKVVANAPADLDTLKEIADYIESDKTGAAQMVTQIDANAKAISAEVTRAQGAESALGKAVSTKQDALDEEQMAAVNSGVTANKVKKLDGIEAGAQKNPDLSDYAKTTQVTKAIKEAVEPKADRSELPYKLVEQPIGDTQLQDRAMTHIKVENGTVVSCDWTAIAVPPGGYGGELLSIPLDPLITTVLLEDHDFGHGEKTYVVVHVEGYDDRFFLCPYGNDYLTVDDIGPVIDGFFPEDVSPENIRLFYEEKPVNEGATLDPMINKIILRTYGMDYGHQSLTPSNSDDTIPVYAIDSDGNTEEIFRITPSEGDYIYYDCMVIDSITNEYSVHIQLSTGTSYYMVLGSASSTPFIPGEYVAGTLVGWDDDTGVETTIENVRILVPDLQAYYASGYGYMELDFYSKNDSSTPIATTSGTRHINDYNFGLGESFTGYVFHPCAFGYTGAMIDYSGSYEDQMPPVTAIPWQDAPAAIFNSGASLDVSHVHIPKVSWALYLTSKNYEYKFRIPPPLLEGRVRNFGLCVDLDQESSLQLIGDGTVKEATEGALTLAAGRTMVYVTEPVSGELYASSKELPA